MSATAIDTSVLIDAERSGQPLRATLPAEHEPYYVPAMAAAEFMAGVHLVKRKTTQEVARRFYEEEIKPLVDSFGEREAARLGQLNAELRQSGGSMKFYDAVIAATALARGDAIYCADSDYDRLKPALKIVQA